jgi:hypothetical protein
MPAPKGSAYWKQRKKHGTVKTFGTPEELWSKACDYFANCDENPWIRKEPVKSGDMAGTCMDVEKARPYTKAGLADFLGVTRQSLKNYEKTEGYENYFEVSERINDIIFAHQLTGATVGEFNASIVQRSLGLVDKQERDNRNSLEELEESVIDEKLAAMFEEYANSKES